MFWRAGLVKTAAIAILMTAVGASALVAQEKVSEATGADLRGLDKVDGAVRDIKLPIGGSADFGSLTVTLGDCRFPVGNPSGDGFAYVTISEKSSGKVDFAGWMIASAPALDALDHPRYDVWLLRCTTE